MKGNKQVNDMITKHSDFTYDKSQQVTGQCFSYEM